MSTAGDCIARLQELTTDKPTATGCRVLHTIHLIQHILILSRNGVLDDLLTIPEEAWSDISVFSASVVDKCNDPQIARRLFTYMSRQRGELLYDMVIPAINNLLNFLDRINDDEEIQQYQEGYNEARLSLYDNGIQ
jgi:hypothetical protein